MRAHLWRAAAHLWRTAAQLLLAAAHLWWATTASQMSCKFLRSTNVIHF